MPNLVSVDWVARRAYLHVDTVASGFSSAGAYAEVRQLQADNSAVEQHYQLFVERFGGVFKDLLGTRRTPIYTTLLSGWRWVPQDTPHTLELLDECLGPAEGIADQGVFDRTGTASNVDIDPVYQQVEFVTVSAGGSVWTAEEKALALGRLASIQALGV